MDLPLFVLQRGKLRHRGRGGLTQVCLAAGKGGVRIPDTDGSDSLSSGPLCVLQRLAPSWHQTCLFSAWLGDPSPPRLAPSGASIKSHTGSLPNESLLGIWGQTRKHWSSHPAFRGLCPGWTKGDIQSQKSGLVAVRSRTRARGCEMETWPFLTVLRAPSSVFKPHQSLPSKRQQGNKVPDRKGSDV